MGAPEVEGDAPRTRPPPGVAGVLRDLVSWAADIAILLTRGCPEDREAIERVRRCAYAWLANESCPDIAIDDVLTTAAALMAGIDRTLGGTIPDDEDDERNAIGAAVPT
ncbi:MAG: hypothetical protein E6J91_00650 [Deltaproteobacteria bacterium]|nr:MAG: hypothetical protein E6J91_00650 [Deltaproteobacteria bacterium]